MRKQRMKVVVVLAIIATVVMVDGCKKCYNCSNVYADLYCIKNFDTLILATYTGKQLSDTVAYYTNKGYTCDTIDYYYRSYDLWYKNPVCNESTYNKIISEQNVCTTIK